MAKISPEKLAAALRANLKKRKASGASATPKTPENAPENAVPSAPGPAPLKPPRKPQP